MSTRLEGQTGPASDERGLREAFADLATRATKFTLIAIQVTGLTLGISTALQQNAIRIAAPAGIAIASVATWMLLEQAKHSERFRARRLPRQTLSLLQNLSAGAAVLAAALLAFYLFGLTMGEFIS